MAGAEVPAAGELGEDTNTNPVQEQLFEDLAEAVRRVAGVGVASPDVNVISAGSITPDEGMVLVDTEGAVAADDLDTISNANYLQDSLIWVIAANNSRDVTIKHLAGGTGQIVLLDGADFVLGDTTKAILLREVGGLWLEVLRVWGTDIAGARGALGLGTAALLDDGNVDAATLGGVAPAGYLPVAGTAANSALLSGLAVAAFLRADLASLQSIAGSLRANSGILQAAAALASGAPRVGLVANALERTQFVYDGVNEEAIWRLLDTDESTVLGGVRVRDGEVPEYWDKASGTWASLGIVPPFPSLGKVWWDKLDAGEVVSGAADRRVLASIDMPDLPGSGATKTLRVSFGVTMLKIGGTPATWIAELYAGDNGDETDTLIAAGLEKDTSASSDISELSDIDLYSVTGLKLTLVLNRTNGQTATVQPATTALPGAVVAHNTYIQADQIA